MSFENGVSFFDHGDRLFAGGLEQEKKGLILKAFNTYLWALEYYQTGLKYCKDPHLKARRREVMLSLLTRAEGIKPVLPAIPGSREEENLDPERKALRARLSSSMSKLDHKLDMDSVAGLFQAKRALVEAITIPVKFPHLYKGKRKPWKGILLYGPPGTGKTLLAKAASSLVPGQTFFQISSADLVSRTMGENERLLRELFLLARDHSPSIIFIDEMDSVSSERCSSNSESEAMNRMKTELLVQMQNLHDVEGVLVIGATNRPFDIDPAVRRRFEKRIYVPLPSKLTRESILTLSLKGEKHRFTSKYIASLAARTEGWSGADLEILVREACMGPLREASHSTLWRKSNAPSGSPVPHCYTPARAKGSWPFSETVETTMNELDPRSVKLNLLERKDFEEALRKLKPSTNREEILLHEKFTEMYGEQPSPEDLEAERQEEERRMPSSILTQIANLLVPSPEKPSRRIAVPS